MPLSLFGKQESLPGALEIYHHHQTSQHLNLQSIIMYSVFECETCDREFGSDGARAQHMNALDHWATRYECDFCTDAFFSQDECDNHMDEYGHHRWDCDTCNQNFASSQAASQHMDARGHWEHYCSECERKFDNANNLRMVGLIIILGIP